MSSYRGESTWSDRGRERSRERSGFRSSRSRDRHSRREDDGGYSRPRECMFYSRIGACRHGDKCQSVHNKPAFSQTVLIPHMFHNTLAKDILEGKVDESLVASRSDKPDPDFEEFYIDVFEELQKFGEIEDLIVCNNLCDHLLGNVYVKYYDEEDADRCIRRLKGRYYGGKRLEPEFSSATDFFRARCRKYDSATCARGRTCNYMHIKRVGLSLERALLRDQPYHGHRSRRHHSRRDRSRSWSSSSRSPSRDRRRRRDRKGRDRSRSSRSRSSSRSYSSSSNSEAPEKRPRSGSRH